MAQYNKTFIPVIIIGIISLLILPNVQGTFAVSPEKPSIERAREMAFDETRLTMFVLNQDETLSAYDFVKNDFVVSRKQLPGVSGARRIFTSPNGSWLAVFSFTNQSSKITIFQQEAVFTSPTPMPTTVYTLPPLAVGRLTAKFSDDERSLIFNHGENSVYILGTRETSQERIVVGDIPNGIDFDESGRLLVLNEKSENLNIIDLAKRVAIADVKLGPNPKQILFNKITDKAYVSHTGSDEVYVVDTKKAMVVKRIRVGSGPVDLVYDEKTGEVFVANNSSGSVSIIKPDFSVATIDLQSPAYFSGAPLYLFYLQEEKELFIINASETKFFVYSIVNSTIIGEGKTDAFPLTVMGSKKLGTVFIQHGNANSIFAINGIMLTTQRIPEAVKTAELFFSRPQGIAIDPENNRIFVTNLGDNTITVIDGNTQKPLTKITVGSSPQAVGFQPTTKKLYTYSPVDNTVAVVDTTQEGYPVKIINTGKQPYGIAFNQKTNSIYVSNAADASISVIDGVKDEIISTIALPKGSYPLILSINEDLNKIYSAAYGSNFVTVIDGAENKVEKQITVGQNPLWIRYIPMVKRVFVVVEGEKKITIIDAETDEIIQNIDTDGIPYRIFFDPVTNYAYINFRKGGEVAVLAPDKDLSSYKIIKKRAIPFWGETDIFYNMTASNRKTGLTYFTSDSNNSVVVVKNERDSENILSPVWYATINADGSVTYSAQAKEQAEKFEKKAFPLSVSRQAQIVLITLALVVILGIIVLILLKKRKATPPTSI